MLKGIDVSEHQGRIDWERVKGNIDFAILRAGYGRNNIDKQFIRNIEECNRLCIPVGIYWFSYAWNTEMARNEARYVLEAIKGYRVDYPISYDLEYDTLNYASKNGVTIGKRLATDM
ncbi:TPA: GH25 family lysozyme, partial [Clostridium perfringens]